tara:strand:+ start:3505 stop:4383 length:879 start_codon:yes stop_codon:yes gene_type:complete
MIKIGLIGVGAMGSRIATRLIDHGYELRLHNRSTFKLHEFKDTIAVLSASPQELVGEVDLIITMLSDDSAVKSVFTLEKLFKDINGKGKTIIDMSTISPHTTKEMSQLASASGNAWLDAPVLGSTPAAQSGDLVFLVGGSKDKYENVKKIFRILGRKSIYMGESGSGQAAKLVHNSICGVLLSSMAEAITLGENLNLDKLKLLELFKESAFFSPIVQAKLPLIEKDSYEPMFKLELMEKDIKLAIEAYKKLGVSPNVLKSSSVMFTEANSEGLGNSDCSAVIKYFLEKKVLK